MRHPTSWKKRPVAAGLVFLFIFFVPSALNAGLDSFHFKIIRTAFINGYVRALDADAETVRALKRNGDALRRHVAAAAQEYMDLVAKMNERASKAAGGSAAAQAFEGKVW